MTKQIQASELHPWLREALGSGLIQAERERDKLSVEIRRAVDTLTEFCAQLTRKAEQDMEMKRENRAQYRAAKAVARLTTILPAMCKDFTVPEQKTSTSLRNLQRETAKLASDAARTREEWLRQIRPYYIIDTMSLGGNVDKLRRLSDELHTFLMGRGAILHSLEEIDEKLESLKTLQGTKAIAVSQRKTIEERLRHADETDQTLKTQAQKVRRDEKMRRFDELDGELRELRGELIRTGFSRLGRPIKKLISISERGDYPLPIEVRESAREYISKPFTSFLSETDGYPRLKALMTSLSKAVDSGKLALKQREANKVIERTQQVVERNSLATIHESALKAKAAYDQCVSDAETATLVRQLKELRKRGKENRKLQMDLRSALERASENERQAEEQIRSLLRELQALARKLTGTEVTLEP